MPFKKTKIWVAVADGGSYRIFSCDKLGGKLKLVFKGENPDQSTPTSDLGSERPGRSRAGPGQGRHALQNKVDWHNEAERNFARDLGARLKDRFLKKSFDKLFVVAPPKTLGEIRDRLPLTTWAKAIPTWPRT